MKKETKKLVGKALLLLCGGHLAASTPAVVAGPTLETKTVAARDLSITKAPSKDTLVELTKEEQERLAKLRELEEVAVTLPPKEVVEKIPELSIGMAIGGDMICGNDVFGPGNSYPGGSFPGTSILGGPFDAVSSNGYSLQAAGNELPGPIGDAYFGDLNGYIPGGAMGDVYWWADAGNAALAGAGVGAAVGAEAAGVGAAAGAAVGAAAGFAVYAVGTWLDGGLVAELSDLQALETLDQIDQVQAVEKLAGIQNKALGF